MKLFQMMKRIFIPLVFVALSLVYHPQQAHAVVFISARAISIDYEIYPQNPPPHSICTVIRINAELTVTVGESEYQGAYIPPEIIDALVYSPNEDSLIDRIAIEVPWGQTSTVSFTIRPNMYTYTRFYGVHYATSSYPFTVIFHDYETDPPYEPIGAMLIDPTEFNTPCFDRMTRGVPFGLEYITSANRASLYDTRLNHNADANVVIYPHPDGSIEIYGIDANSRGYPTILLTPEEIAALPPKPKENLLIEQFGDIALYKLTTGEYQVNVGPDINGNVQVYILDPTLLTQARRADFNIYTDVQ